MDQPCQPLHPYQVLRKAGSLRNGGEADKGSVWHAVADGRSAICGAMPAIEWSTYESDRVTCPRCLKRIESGSYCRD